MNFKQFKAFSRSTPVNQARILLGPPGIGKSSVVKQLANEMGYQMIDLRLSELEPQDLVGMPVVKENVEHVQDDGSVVVRDETHYATPSWWPTHGKYILFLDEVDRAREDMQPLAMQLTLDRTAGGRKLPDGVIVFAAANGEKYQTVTLDQALVNRFAWIEFTPEPSEWLQWASQKDSGIHPSVVSFMRETDASSLNTPDGLIAQPNMQVPTPRSWAFLGQHLQSFEDMHPDMNGEAVLELARNPDNFGINLATMAKPYVGDEISITFSSWVRSNYDVLSPKDVFTKKGLKQAKSGRWDVRQISNIIDEVAEIFADDKTSFEEQTNCAKFFMAIDNKEVFATFFWALPKECAPTLSKIPGAKAYVMDAVKNVKKDS